MINSIFPIPPAFKTILKKFIPIYTVSNNIIFTILITKIIERLRYTTEKNKFSIDT